MSNKNQSHRPSPPFVSPHFSNCYVVFSAMQQTCFHVTPFPQKNPAPILRSGSVAQ
jgi:hypothetical protein